MSLGTQRVDSEWSPSHSLNGSYRKTGSGSVSPGRSTHKTGGELVPNLENLHNILKGYSSKLADFNTFSEYLEDWLREKLYGRENDGGPQFSSPFSVDELRTFDFAVESVPFQQLLRMPYPPHGSDCISEDELLAVEDFLYTAVDGVWRTFWHKKKPLPFSVACPCSPGSKKFYPVEKAISKGRIKRLCGAALIWDKNHRSCSNSSWGDIVKFVMFRQCLRGTDGFWLSPTLLCEAVFYAVHILISRCLVKQSVATDCVFVSIIDRKFGEVVKLSGDLSKLDFDSSNPYQAITEWITIHGDICISHMDPIWNKLGNVNWGDLGALQILLATFYSIVQCIGPPRKSMASLASIHILRLQKRRMETQITETEEALVPHVKTMEISEETNQKHQQQASRLNLSPVDIILLEDQEQGLRSFQIQERLDERNSSYIAFSTTTGTELLNLQVGAHPSLLQPSWEDMNLWYSVQRQTKVLNILKQRGVSCRNLPEIVASGRIMHPGSCEKQGTKERCSHPWCGTPILVTYPVGDPVSCFRFLGDEIAACCRDCLIALRNAKMANVLHGDIRPENVVRIVGNEDQNAFFVLVSWGRAVLEERESPPLNLQFSSTYTLQHGKLCPSSDIESLVYLIYFISGAAAPPLDSIESALKWRKRSWAKRVFQQRLGEISPILKAFADYVDSICGTTYHVDYDVWITRLNRAADGYTAAGESSGTSAGGISH